MSKLVITRGYPGSGKTTFARRWVICGTKRSRVNRDDLRHALYGQYAGLGGWQEAAVTKAQRGAVERLLEAGYDVIVDDTNLRLRTARDWLHVATKMGAEFEVIDVTTDREECRKRDQRRGLTGRDRWVGYEVIDSFAERYPMPWPEVTLPERTESKVLPYVPDPSLPKAILVDIDGTVAEMGDRNPYDESRVSEDRPKEAVIRFVWAMLHAGYEIVFMSGRKESCRRETTRWLNMHVTHSWNELHMRAKDDNRSDRIVKAELFDEHVRDRFNVVAVLDDRDSVVALWREMGLTCLQVAEGNF